MSSRRGISLSSLVAKRKLDPFLPIIHEILERDRQAPKKQRHTAQRIFDRLVAEHDYDGGYYDRQRGGASWKHGQAEVFVPLSHRPGTAQADFGEVTVVLNGETIKAAFFVITLPYSDAIFCQVFPKECTETFQEGHRRAFEFFGGVPRRISYDNSKIAVLKIVGGRGREATREFLRLESHYLFEHHFCRVRRPNEKGHVENLLGFARRNFLVPIPEVESLEALNAQLIEHCRRDLQRQLRGKAAPKESLLAEEQSAMLAIPAKRSSLAAYETAGQANSLSLVRFDGNDYSVPTAYAHHQVTVSRRYRRSTTSPSATSWWLGINVTGERSTPSSIRFTTWLSWSVSQELSITLGPWKIGNFLFGFTVLRRRQEGVLKNLATREFIKVLRLLETGHVAGVDRGGGLRVIDRCDERRCGAIDPSLSAGAAGRSVLPGRSSSLAGSACPASQSPMPINPCEWEHNHETHKKRKAPVLLKHHLKALKLPTMHNECEKVASRCAGEKRGPLGLPLATL